MALQVPSYTGDPTSTAPVANTYVEVIEFHLANPKQTLGFTVGYYRSAADFAAGVNPINTASYSITPNPEKRNDGAEIPSYSQVVGTAVTLSSDPAGTLAFALVERAIVTFLLTLPEFAGATVVA